MSEGNDQLDKPITIDREKALERMTAQAEFWQGNAKRLVEEYDEDAVDFITLAGKLCMNGLVELLSKQWSVAAESFGTCLAFLGSVLEGDAASEGEKLTDSLRTYIQGAISGISSLIVAIWAVQEQGGDPFATLFGSVLAEEPEEGQQAPDPAPSGPDHTE